MLQEAGVDLLQSAEDFGAGGEERALPEKGADDIHAHLDRALAAEDICGHERAVLGEDPRAIGLAAVFVGTGHNL